MDDKDKNQENVAEFNINLDTTPVYYTDNIQMIANEDGVVLDICQRLGVTNKIRVVSRVGMSRNHAKKFLKSLKDLLDNVDGQVQTGKIARA